MPKRHEMDYVLLFTVLILTSIGVLTIYSASTVIALQSGLPASYYAERQLMSAGIGILILFGLSFIHYRVWYKWSAVAMAGSLFLLMVVLIPHVGWSAYGGRRWIGHGSMHLQPSEISMVALTMYLAFFFTKKVMLVQNFKKGLVPALVVVLINFLMVMAEPDMGTAMTLLATCLVVIVASGARLKPLLYLAIPGIIALVLFATLWSYRSDRIKAWLDPLHYQTDQAYQVVSGWTAISAGGWFGRGFDMSIEKMGYLPFPQTDFIFPVFVEEWGYIGALVLLATFFMLLWRGFYTARRAPDRFSALLSLGLTSLVMFKSLINLGAVTGLVPVTGIPLPFISFGGTSLIVNMAAMGVVLSISRFTLTEEPEFDQLADVISVEDVEHLRGQKTVEPRLRNEPRIVSTRRAADVHFLGSKEQTRVSSTHTWRGRQETAATRSSQTERKTSTTANHGTWRSRNASGTSLGTGSGGTASRGTSSVRTAKSKKSSSKTSKNNRMYSRKD